MRIVCIMHTAYATRPHFQYLDKEIAAMNPTLVSLAQTLQQVAPRMGRHISPHGAFVAGLFALTMGAAVDAKAQEASSVRDMSSAQTQVQSTEPSQPQGKPLSEQASRNIGRAVGGVLGYMVGKATDAGTTMKAVLTVGGLLVGDQVAKAQSQQAHSTPQEGSASALTNAAGMPSQAPWTDKVDPLVLAALNPGNPKPRPGTQPLPPDLAKGMTDLVVDATAHRFLAQEAWTTAHMAASTAAVRPLDANAAQVSAQAAQNFKDAMRRNNQSFYWFRNAVGTLQNSGFDVEKYLALNRVLSQNVDRNGMVHLGHPNIRLRVDELAGRQAAGRADLVDLEAHSRIQLPEAARADVQR
jgi:hypothetical protein